MWLDMRIILFVFSPQCSHSAVHLRKVQLTRSLVPSRHRKESISEPIPSLAHWKPQMQGFLFEGARLNWNVPCMKYSWYTDTQTSNWVIKLFGKFQQYSYGMAIVPQQLFSDCNGTCYINAIISAYSGILCKNWHSRQILVCCIVVLLYGAKFWPGNIEKFVICQFTIHILPSTMVCV